MNLVAEKKAQEMFASVPESIREDIELASKWARETLRDHEGAGHVFYVTAAGSRHPGLVVCSFSKPAWNADHCSRPMEHGALAVVMAVCEYLNGL